MCEDSCKREKEEVRKSSTQYFLTNIFFNWLFTKMIYFKGQSISKGIYQKTNENFVGICVKKNEVTFYHYRGYLTL